MRGILVKHPLDYRLEVQGDSFAQGSSLPCTILVKNHGDTPADLHAFALELTLANLKKVKAKDAGAFGPAVVSKIDKKHSIPGKGQISLTHTFTLDINAPIADKSQTLYLLYGESSDRTSLGQLPVTVTPHPHLRAIFDTFTSACSFVAKGETWKDEWTFARLKPPESRRMSFVEELNFSAHFTSENLEVSYAFSVKKFDTSMTKVDVKKGKTIVQQTWPRSEYLFGGEFFNQQYAEKMIEAALSEVSSGL